MAANVGRKVTFEWNSAEINGVREKSAACNGAPINVTSDESDGWQALLTDSAEDSVTISLSGVTKENTLRADWFAGTKTRAVTIGYLDGGTLTGNFFLASYSEGMPYNDAVTFEAELQSAGEITYTAPAAPTNTLLPSISGVAQEDETLTAVVGQWTGAPTSYTYQWQEDSAGWADISGATSSTYVPVTGDVGNGIRVQVTAVNSAGSLEVNSAATADVIGA